MSKTSQYIALFAAAGFGLAATGSAWAQEDQHGQGATELEPQHVEEPSGLEIPDIFTPEGDYSSHMVAVPEGIMVIPGSFEPTIRVAVACKDAPSTDRENAYYSNAVGYILSVSETDLALSGADSEMFFTEYGAALNLALNSVFTDVVNASSPEDVAGFTAEFQQDYATAVQGFMADFERASDITVRADIVFSDRMPNGGACAGRPPRMGA